ncbi:hypothetical protein F66182_170 [Fusarium sp. NRRL 66182]|nr:hypothetical protein F66182_170 [Fusarium sp. NRRL 66182]
MDIALGVDMAMTRGTASNTGMVVILNGLPGTGKSTILKNLESQMTGQKIQIIDSHILTEPVRPDRGFNHYNLRRQLRAVYLREVRNLADQGYTVLMTACLKKNEADSQVVEDTLGILRETNITMSWINVHCEQSIPEQRATSPERVEDCRSRPTDLRRITKEDQLILPTNRRYKLDGISLVTARLDVGRSLKEAVDNISGIMGRERSRL